VCHLKYFGQAGSLLNMLNKSDAKIGSALGGRFGKYGDAKRNAQIRKSR